MSEPIDIDAIEGLAHIASVTANDDRWVSTPGIVLSRLGELAESVLPALAELRESHGKLNKLQDQFDELAVQVRAQNSVTYIRRTLDAIEKEMKT